MSQMIKLMKRIKKDDNLILADKGEETGDLFKLSKYFYDSGFYLGNSYRHATILPGTELLIDKSGNRVYCKSDIDKAEAKEFMELYLEGTGSYYGRTRFLELGQHTLAKPFGNGYSWSISIPFGTSFRYRKTRGAKKIPLVRYDVRNIFPDEVRDEKGNFKYTLDNVKMYNKMIEEAPTTSPYRSSRSPNVRCMDCGRREDVKLIKDDKIKAVVRGREGNLFLRLKCSACNSDKAHLSVVPTANININIPNCSSVENELRLSDEYYVRIRNNGGAWRPKLFKDGSDNFTEFNPSNWGKVFLKDVMEYAEKRNLPVEVDKDVMVYI